MRTFWVTVMGCFLLSGNTLAFDPPSCGDPWYCQDDNIPMQWVPDKAQHYWGSYALSAAGQNYLGTKAGVITSILLGYLWEVKDSKTSFSTTNGGTVGFSYRDLIADGLGSISAWVNRNKNVKMWLHYSTGDEAILFNVSVKL